MPPHSPIPNENEDRLLPPGHKSGAGGTVGIIIIVLLLIFGALYFWGAHLNNQANQTPVPYIPGDISTTSAE
jgi:hypothetical protein